MSQTRIAVRQPVVRMTSAGPLPAPSPLPVPVPVPQACPSVERVAFAPNVDLTVSRRVKQELLAQAQRAEEALPTLIIQSSLLTIFSAEELAEIAMAVIDKPEQSGINTVNDPRMGVIEDNQLCATCHKDNQECPGHLGMIRLAYPIYHPLYLRTIVQILTCVCNSCGGLLMTRQEMKDKRLLLATGNKRLQFLEKECKGLMCRREPEQGVRDCPMNPEYLVSKIKDTKQIMYRIPSQGNKEVARHITDVEKILNSISEEDAQLMGFGHGSHPRRMIMRALPVIPPVARPPAVREGVIYPNPLTSMYIEIIKANNLLMDLNLTEKQRMEYLANLFFHVEHLIDNTDNRYAPQQHKVFESIKQLVQGKEPSSGGCSWARGLTTPLEPSSLQILTSSSGRFVFLRSWLPS